MPVAVVTDSTSSLPSDLVETWGIRVVPLHVIIGEATFAEGDEAASPVAVARALREHRSVSTSRPSPAAFLEAYRAAMAEGATEIVSVHISSEISGTYESAQLAAKQVPIPVHCVDTGQAGIGVGFAAAAAARAVEAGADAMEASRWAHWVSAGTRSLFYVDTLEYLRRGGRVGTAAALVGSALAVKPILTIEDGRIVSHEKVRTSSRALARLRELAVEAAGDDGVDIAVAHLVAESTAADLAHSIGAAVPGLHGDEVLVGEVGAVLGAHVGPGMVAVCVAPHVEVFHN